VALQLSPSSPHFSSPHDHTHSHFLSVEFSVSLSKTFHGFTVSLSHSEPPLLLQWQLRTSLLLLHGFFLAKHKNPLQSSQEYTLAPLALVITALVSKLGSLWNAIDLESDRRSSLDSNTSIEIRGFENPTTFLSSTYGSLRTLGHEHENRIVESGQSRRLLKRRF
jgi:hypothetical protein